MLLSVGNTQWLSSQRNDVKTTDTCSLLFQTKFCGFALFLITLHPANSSTMLITTEGVKGPLKSSSPTLLLKRGQLAQGAQDNHVQSGLEHHTETSQPLQAPCSPLSTVTSGHMEFCVVFFVLIVSYLLSLGTTEKSLASTYSIPLHQICSDADKDPPEPPDLTSSEREQLSHNFSDNIPSWYPFSSCLSVITPTDPTIYLNYWSLFSLIQLFNTWKYLLWFSSAIQFHSNPLSSSNIKSSKTEQNPWNCNHGQHITQYLQHITHGTCFWY